MTLKLYHYVHCPFCLRVRMALGFLKLPFQSIVLPYEDEETPIALAGKKMLPIMDFGNGFITNESLIIIENLDKKNALKIKLLTGEEKKKIENLLDKLGTNIHSLCMPYFIYTKEFNEISRNYFLKKKEVKRGPFNKLVLNRDVYLTPLQKDLNELEKSLQPFYLNEVFSIFDILIASHLWGLYILPEFQFSEKLHKYLQEIKQICDFNYEEDLWRN